MKTAIICISDPYLDRGLKLKKYYESKGDTVVILTPDFSHRSKTRIQEQLEGVRYLPHLAYRKNLSFSRMAGHYFFARTCRKELEKIRPDRIHCLIPANSLAGQMSEYKNVHPEVFLVFDIIDMWPESLPLLSRYPNPVSSIWRKMRDSHLQDADLVLTECSYYQKALFLHNPKLKLHTLYWMTEKSARITKKSPELPKELHFLYLGSINNLIDIPVITAFLRELSSKRTVVLEVVGAGERKVQFLQEVRNSGVEVIDHGEIYDPEKKSIIASGCHFGLNIIKPDTYIGLSMKSLDYLAYGLPVINTLPADSRQLFSDGKAGFNLENGKTASVCRRLAEISNDEVLEMKTAAASLYDSVFSELAFNRSLAKAYEEIGQQSLES